MTPHVWVLCGITLLLLSVSALVSGSETAFFSLSANDVRALKKSASSNAQTILSLLGRVDLLLATILVVNNLVNICIVILSSNIIDALFTFARFEFLVKSVLVTFLLLLFGEILPKVAAQTMPMRFAGFVARPMAVLQTIFYPLSYLLMHTGSRLCRKAAHRQEISIDELADAIDMTHTSSKEEHGMLSGIVSFVNTEVQEIMKPRVDMTAIALTDPYEQVKQTIINSGFSRIPVYEGDLDNIRGTLYVKDLLPHINQSDEFGWQQLIRKPYFVPEHKKINDLLEDFQAKKIHMAIVVDEYGSTQGLVSLEDIIEEVVGEISDESDTDEALYTRLDANTYLFDGKTHIVDFERIVEIDEDTFADVKGRAETLAGLMLELRCDFLKKGDTVTAHGIRFVVHHVEGHRIDKIKVILHE
ncbi:MAG: gliding motility-associated protein GldE [Alistipes sp.]|nr:gliding motility-associated protein GldE [Alistipes sp.]